jgi:hypothetical protein
VGEAAMKKKGFDPIPIIFLAAVLLLALFQLFAPKSNVQQETSPFPTSYSHDRKGVKGLFLVLESLGKESRRWVRPLSLLEREESGTLIVINPQKPLSPRDKEALDMWFSKGGRMCFIHDSDWDIKASGYDEEPRSFQKIFGDNPLVSMIKDPDRFSNLGLKDHPEKSVEIIQQLLSYPGPVYFDEYHLNNGEMTSPWVLFIKFCHLPVGWVTLHILAVFMLYLLSTPASSEIEEDNEKEKTHLIKARASFLELCRAEKFAAQVISKYRSRNHDGY